MADEYSKLDLTTIPKPHLKETTFKRNAWTENEGLGYVAGFGVAFGLFLAVAAYQKFYEWKWPEAVLQQQQEFALKQLEKLNHTNDLIETVNRLDPDVRKILKTINTDNWYAIKDHL
jgi:hypothetical protein